MDFFETVSKRCSIRSFLNKEIEKEKITKLLETIVLAPSAGNLQAYKIAIVKDKKIKKALAAAASDQEFIAEAPVVLVFLADIRRSSMKYGDRGASLYALQDATIAAAYAQLAAAALGLTSVWIGAFDENKIANSVRAEKWERPIAIIPIGYAAAEPEQRERRKLSEIVKEL